MILLLLPLLYVATRPLIRMYWGVVVVVFAEVVKVVTVVEVTVFVQPDPSNPVRQTHSPAMHSPLPHSFTEHAMIPSIRLAPRMHSSVVPYLNCRVHWCRFHGGGEHGRANQRKQRGN